MRQKDGASVIFPDFDPPEKQAAPHDRRHGGGSLFVSLHAPPEAGGQPETKYPPGVTRRKAT